MLDQQLEIGIDWLTMTSPKVQDVSGLVESVLRAIPIQSTGKPFHFLGYRGEVYVDDEGHLAWGIKMGHGIVQLSGAWSNRVFRELDAFRLRDYRCTRLDTAVTVCLRKPEQLVRDLLAYHSLRGGNWTAITKDNGEGGTLYIGCRKSDQFGRLYDKGAEIRSRLGKSSIPDALLWRYEVEYKRSMAVAQRDHLAELVRDGRRLDDTIATDVHNWFLRRGVGPTFNPIDTYSSVVQVATRVVSSEKTLDWFRVQVAPAMRRVNQEVSTDAILHALGVELDGSAYIRLDRTKTTPLQLSLWDYGQEAL